MVILPLTVDSNPSVTGGFEPMIESISLRDGTLVTGEITLPGLYDANLRGKVGRSQRRM